MWIVVDYKRFRKGAPLLSGVLTIAEGAPPPPHSSVAAPRTLSPSMPLVPRSPLLWPHRRAAGLISTSDETLRLATSGYFASFNQPYLNATVHASGAAAYDAAMRKQGVTAYSYQLAGRAHLFRAYAHMLRSLDGAKKLLRWNKHARATASNTRRPPPGRRLPHHLAATAAARARAGSRPTGRAASPDPSRLVVPATYGALASRGDLNRRGAPALPVRGADELGRHQRQAPLERAARPLPDARAGRADARRPARLQLGDGAAGHPEAAPPRTARVVGLWVDHARGGSGAAVSRQSVENARY